MRISVFSESQHLLRRRKVVHADKELLETTAMQLYNHHHPEAGRIMQAADAAKVHFVMLIYLV